LAIVGAAQVLEHQLFLQGDGRDPLGVWGARVGITGDASGGTIKTGFLVSTTTSGGRIYTCYDAQVAGLSSTVVFSTLKTRLLTNRPDIDVLAGLQGYASLLVGSGFPGFFDADNSLTPPIAGPSIHLISSNQRFILLFGPGPGQETVNILEIEIDQNINLATYSFEAYGYFWDRQVVNVPGGPRHPGSG